MTKQERFSFSLDQFEKLIEQGCSVLEEISDKEKKKKKQEKSQLSEVEPTQPIKPEKPKQKKPVEKRVEPKKVKPTPKPTPKLKVAAKKQSKPVPKKVEKPAVKPKPVAKKVVKQKKQESQVFSGLIPYLDMLDFSNLLEFTNSLESEADTLGWDRQNGHMPKEASTDTNKMYSHYVNRDGEATSALGLDCLIQEKLEWGDKFQKDIAREMKPPLRAAGWFWGGNLPEVRNSEHLGRFYLSLYHPYALEFWEELFYIKQELKRTDLDIKYKMSDKFESLKRGDCAVVYFEMGAQLRVYNLMAEMIENHIIWFKENIPMFTAQMLDGKGQPLRGMSFGQNPALDSSSFGYQRALALSAACKEIRKKVAKGQPVSKQQAYQLVASHLKIRNVDVDNPAFNIGGTTLFSTIFRFTDQFRRQKS